MATPYPKGILVGSILPLIYKTPELNDIRLTSHKFITDFYTPYFSHFGFSQSEMKIVMPIVERIDVLTGTHTDEYLPAPKGAWKDK